MKSETQDTQLKGKKKPETLLNRDRWRVESDSLGEVKVPADRLWGAQTQRSLEHFSIGQDLIPREMIAAYATLKKAAANANHAGGRLERLGSSADRAGLRRDPGRAAPRHVSAACVDDRQRHAVQHERQRGDVQPLLPTRGYRAGQQGAGASERSREHVAVVKRFVSLGDVHRRRCERDRAADCRRSPVCATLIAAKAEEWKDIVKIGRTHMQDATPITLGQEWSGYAGMLSDDIERMEDALKGVYRLALGGTAVGTGINAAPGFAEAAAAEIAKLTGSAVRQRAEQVHRAGRARCAGAALRHLPHAGGIALQDRQ